MERQKAIAQVTGVQQFDGLPVVLSTDFGNDSVHFTKSGQTKCFNALKTVIQQLITQ